MIRTIAITNQKGGVGKTTSCVNLAASFAATHHRTLLIDMDPQGNATMGSGINKEDVSYSINDVLLEKCSIQDAIFSTQAGYDVVPANRDLTEAEVVLVKAHEGQGVLKQAVEKAALGYDFILLDCPPSLNMLTVNALVIADSVLVPMKCEYYALEGLASLLQTIEQIKETVNPHLEIEGLLRTMYDGRNRLANEVSNQLLEHFGKQVFETVIPRNVRLAEAPSHGLPALLYDKSSQGATAYLVLAGELLRKYQNDLKKVK